MRPPAANTSRLASRLQRGVNPFATALVGSSGVTEIATTLEASTKTAPSPSQSQALNSAGLGLRNKGCINAPQAFALAASITSGAVAHAEAGAGEQSPEGCVALCTMLVWYSMHGDEGCAPSVPPSVAQHLPPAFGHLTASRAAGRSLSTLKKGTPVGRRWAASTIRQLLRGIAAQYDVAADEAEPEAWRQAFASCGHCLLTVVPPSEFSEVSMALSTQSVQVGLENSLGSGTVRLLALFAATLGAAPYHSTNDWIGESDGADGTTASSRRFLLRVLSEAPGANEDTAEPVPCVAPGESEFVAAVERLISADLLRRGRRKQFVDSDGCDNVDAVELEEMAFVTGAAARALLTLGFTDGLSRCVKAYHGWAMVVGQQGKLELPHTALLPAPVYAAALKDRAHGSQVAEAVSRYLRVSSPSASGSPLPPVVLVAIMRRLIPAASVAIAQGASEDPVTLLHTLVGCTDWRAVIEKSTPHPDEGDFAVRFHDPQRAALMDAVLSGLRDVSSLALEAPPQTNASAATLSDATSAADALLVTVSAALEAVANKTGRRLRNKGARDGELRSHRCEMLPSEVPSDAYPQAVGVLLHRGMLERAVAVTGQVLDAGHFSIHEWSAALLVGVYRAALSLSKRGAPIHHDGANRHNDDPAHLAQILQERLQQRLRLYGEADTSAIWGTTGLIPVSPSRDVPTSATKTVPLPGEMDGSNVPPSPRVATFWRSAQLLPHGAVVITDPAGLHRALASSLPQATSSS